MSLYTPVTDNMKLDMRMNLKAKKVLIAQTLWHSFALAVRLQRPELYLPGLVQVELKTNPDTPDAGSVQKAADFVQAFILGGSQALPFTAIYTCPV